MSVYIQDDKVLLDDGKVAADTDCCCSVCCGNNSFTYCGFTDGYYGSFTRTDYWFTDCYYHPPFDIYEFASSIITYGTAWNDDCSELTPTGCSGELHSSDGTTTCDCVLDSDCVTWICDPVGCDSGFAPFACGDSVPYDHETIGTETTCYDHYSKQQDDVFCGVGCLVDISADAYSLEELSDYRCPYP